MTSSLKLRWMTCCTHRIGRTQREFWLFVTYERLRFLSFFVWFFAWWCTLLQYLRRGRSTVWSCRSEDTVVCRTFYSFLQTRRISCFEWTLCIGVHCWIFQLHWRSQSHHATWIFNAPCIMNILVFFAHISPALVQIFENSGCCNIKVGGEEFC